jgi:hypothetical protein
VTVETVAQEALQILMGCPKINKSTTELHLMSKIVYVTVKVEIHDDADSYESIENCDYSFLGDGIIDTEIVAISDKK